MTKLKNNAQVLASRKIPNGSIVLAKPFKDKEEYVTWFVDTNQVTLMGNYFTKLPEAIKDYNQRR